MSTPTKSDSPQRATSFAETALTLGGKSAEEARRTGAIDQADEEVEKLFAARYQTGSSPAHRAVWDRSVPVELFNPPSPVTPPDVQRVMDASYELVRRHRSAGTLVDDENKISARVLEELGAAGYFGLLVGKEHGGVGAPFSSFAAFLTRMALADPTVAGLASVHGCIGAVDPVRTFGTPEQKRKFLPDLAAGRRLSGFALTEPAAGSDLTALKTTAVKRGGEYFVTGEKLFITNAGLGRTVGLVCLIEGQPAVLVVDLPKVEDERFKLRRYGLWALKHTHNVGLIFQDFPVPAENLLTPPRGDGLTIAYHGLNLGRVALCANAAGTMRIMMASMLPWARYRKTYGQPIVARELVRRRLARLAGLITASDALVRWCSWLIDEGYRGEMECIVAKIFGSEAQKEAAIELFMKTHGGRSFLRGHLLGDNVHEYLAPCIYEGEGEMLGMAFFKSLVKNHGVEYFEPIGKALAAAGIKRPNFANPSHALALRGPLARYSMWWLKQALRLKPDPTIPPGPGGERESSRLREHALVACEFLQSQPLEISGVMRKFQLALPDRQCRMSELSQRVQDGLVMLVTALYGLSQDDEIVREAADIACQDLRRRIIGSRPSDRYFRQANRLGEAIADGGFKSIAGYTPDEILMAYE